MNKKQLASLKKSKAELDALQITIEDIINNHDR